MFFFFFKSEPLFEWLLILFPVYCFASIDSAGWVCVSTSFWPIPREILNLFFEPSFRHLMSKKYKTKRKQHFESSKYLKKIIIITIIRNVRPWSQVCMQLIFPVSLLYIIAFFLMCPNRLVSYEWCLNGATYCHVRWEIHDRYYRLAATYRLPNGLYILYTCMYVCV